MFKYKAMESTVSAPGEVEGKKWENDVSAGALLMVGEDVIHGIITSVVEILIARGKSDTEIEDIVKEITNAMKTHGDITAASYDWLKDTANIKRLHHYTDYDVFEKANKDGESQDDVKYCPWWALRNSVTRGCNCVLSWGVDRKKYQLNEREKAMLDEMDEIADKYWDMKRKVRDYFEDMAIDLLHDVITKYSDILSKVDTDWFDSISKGMTRAYDDLMKKRAEKKAEDSSVLSRPLEDK